MKQLEFCWDVGSPYTYLAATQLDALCERTGTELIWRPILLGAIFKATHNRPPIEVPAKGRYMLGDLHLWAEYYGVPFRFPSAFPANSLPAMRMAIVADREGLGPAWGQAVMRAFWVEDRDPADPDSLRAIADEIGGDGAVWLAATAEPEIKDALRLAVDQAVERGVFGAPTFFVGEQMFWGNDRLPLIEAALQR